MGDDGMTVGRMGWNLDGHRVDNGLIMSGKGELKEMGDTLTEI